MALVNFRYFLFLCGNLNPLSIFLEPDELWENTLYLTESVSLNLFNLHGSVITSCHVFSSEGLCYTSPTTCFALFAGMAASRASKFYQNAALKVDEPLLWISLTFAAQRKRMNLLIESAIVKWEPITMNQETLVIFHGFMRILPPVLRVIQHRDLLYKDGALIEEPKGKLENKFVSFLLLIS